jgi:hypothetical protein
MGILYDRIREAAKLRKMTLKSVAAEYDKMFNADGIGSIYNSLKVWGSKSDPSATNLCRLSEVLDCDMDFLMGKQETMRRDVSALTEKTGLTFHAMENLLEITTHNPALVPLINSLFAEESEDPYTGKTLVKISSCMASLLYLCEVDFGDPILTGNMMINDAYGKNHHQLVNTADFFRFERHMLYIALCEFIDMQRHKKGLHLYNEI